MLQLDTQPWSCFAVGAPSAWWATRCMWTLALGSGAMPALGQGQTATMSTCSRFVDCVCVCVSSVCVLLLCVGCVEHNQWHVDCALTLCVDFVFC